MNLAGNLQMFRRKMNLSQEVLAEKCRVSRQAIAKWESGDSVPTIEKLVFLADLYELSLDELVGIFNQHEAIHCGSKSGKLFRGRKKSVSAILSINEADEEGNGYEGFN